jgi:hypothetical protein
MKIIQNKTMTELRKKQREEDFTHTCEVRNSHRSDSEERYIFGV